MAANVDLIAIVMGLDGDYNLRRLERYLVQAAASGAEAIVALNKMDVCAEWPARLADVRALTSNTVAVSAHESLAPNVEVVRGRTVVLLGSSGAGKSTIANALLGESRQATQPVRESDSRGRHTTTRRMLIALPDGGALERVVRECFDRLPSDPGRIVIGLDYRLLDMLARVSPGPKSLPKVPPGPWRSLGGYLDYSSWKDRDRFLELDRAIARSRGMEDPEHETNLAIDVRFSKG